MICKKGNIISKIKNLHSSTGHRNFKVTKIKMYEEDALIGRGSRISLTVSIGPLGDRPSLYARYLPPVYAGLLRIYHAKINKYLGNTVKRSYFCKDVGLINFGVIKSN